MLFRPKIDYPMKPIRTLLNLSFILLAALTVSANALADGKEFSYHRPDFKVNPDGAPKSKRAGEVETRNGMKIPVYSLSMPSGSTDGLQTFTPQSRQLDMEIKPEIAAQLDAYAYSEGIILVPKNWTIMTAGAGADGSTSLLFAPDKSGQSYLAFESAGACIGCAYSDASVYFDEARKLAKREDFLFYRKSDLIQSVQLNHAERGYRIKTEGNPVDGIAYFDSSSDFPFFDVQISLPATQHPVATAVLNQFIRK